MDQGFIRGGVGAEVDLMAVLPPTYKAFSTRSQQEAFADSYERQRKVVVKRPWETPEEIEERKAKLAKELANSPQTNGETFGMSPEVAQRQLKMLRGEWRIDHPDTKRKEMLEREIRKIEDYLRIEPDQRTNFGGQTDAEKEEAKKKLLQDQFATYSALKPKARKQVVIGMNNRALLYRIRDEEDNEEVRAEAITRIATLELGA